MSKNFGRMHCLAIFVLGGGIACGNSADSSDGEGVDSGPAVAAELAEQSLSIRRGCADADFYAVNEDDTTIVSIRFPTPIAEAGNVQSETTEYDFPDAGPMLELRTGQFVSDLSCDDVDENVIVIDKTYRATLGSATLVVRPNLAADDTARGDLSLRSVVFTNEDDEGDQITLPLLDWEDISIGWFPG